MKPHFKVRQIVTRFTYKQTEWRHNWWRDSRWWLHTNSAAGSQLSSTRKCFSQFNWTSKNDSGS